MQPYSVRFSAGDVLFAEGDPPDGAFLIESGRIEISIVRSGERRVLSELGPGMLLGEMAVIENSPRSTTARALSDCTLTPIDPRQFAERLASTDPVVRALLTSQLAHYRSMLATLIGDGHRLRESGTMPAGDASALDKIRLDSELRAALERGELDVRLQPVEELASGRIAGYEALVRWPHPRRGEVAPTEFIRLAEETSLIVPVGDYVLARVCETLAELRRRGRQPLPFIALNLSSRQIDDPALVDRIFAPLRRLDLPPDRLKLEITESLVLDHARVATLMRRCHEVGMRVALDDFGTGHSNLDVLLDLDFDQVKLDRRFVHALDHPRGAALAGVAIAMARALGCDIVAEGVETQDQRTMLHRLGCTYAQGWLVGRPQALDEVLGES